MTIPAKLMRPQTQYGSINEDFLRQKLEHINTQIEFFKHKKKICKSMVSGQQLIVSLIDPPSAQPKAKDDLIRNKKSLVISSKQGKCSAV